jgi:hypothetical protein
MKDYVAEELARARAWHQMNYGCHPSANQEAGGVTEIILLRARVAELQDQLATMKAQTMLESVARELADAHVAVEREACAKIADIEADNPHGSNPGCATAESIAAEIRARGEK